MNRQQARRARPRPLRVAVLATLALGLAGIACADGADLPLDQLLTELKARPHRHDRFTERFTTAVLERPLEASGELFYDAPDHLEKRTLKPRTERLVLERRALTIERRHRTYQTTLDEYPQLAPYIESIRATLAGDRSALEGLFHLEYSSHGDEWSLSLAPLAPTLAAEVARIRIEGARAEVRSVVIERTNGDRSAMTLTGAVTP